MPTNRSLYPKDWEAFSLDIRVRRANQQCECTGQCGLHQPIPLGPHLIQEDHGPHRRCREINKQRARYFDGRVKLSVAHTCNCYPICAEPTHVLAMCQRCHLRFDRFRHAAARLRTQASENYRSQRYRRAGKQFGIENLQELMNLPQKKRRTPWHDPRETPPNRK